MTPQRAAALQRVRAGAWLAAHSVIRELDALFCRSYVAVTGEKPVLLVFGFHAVAPRKALSRLDLIVDPAQSVSVESFDLFVTQYRDLGYEFVTPAQVSAGLPAEGRYVMISFDDGYHNNLQVLPVLRKHGVPAVFFISTNHVADQRSFWWDALYRARSHRGVSPETIFREQTYLKTLTHVGIHDHLLKELGSKALTPLGDDDRPLTVAELQAFARDPLVHLGNHTSDHAVLTNYSADGAAEQIGGAQRALEEWTGVRPIMIAYPNGNLSESIFETCDRAGLMMGLSVEARRNSPQIPPAERWRIGRVLLPRFKVRARSYLNYRSPVRLRHIAEVTGLLIFRKWLSS